jgi:ABC-type glycerol-3-phosphate transport system permease component
MYRARRRAAEISRHAILIVILGLSFFGVYWMVETSFKYDVMLTINYWWPDVAHVNLANYADAFQAVYRYILNSVIVSATILIGVLALGTTTAYVFARFWFPGKEVLFYFIISLIMIPGILTFLPTFLVVKSMHLLNTYGALILPGIAGGQVFAIFILRTYFASLPQELIDAARVDGASELVVVSRVVVPLSVPILATVGILNLLATWNDYIWPLVTLRDTSLYTIPIGIAYLAANANGVVSYTEQMAAYVIVSLPLVILFFFMMRSFVQGLSSGAIKV